MSGVPPHTNLFTEQTNGILSPDSARRRWDYLRQADERGTLTVGFTAFVIVGNKNVDP